MGKHAIIVIKNEKNKYLQYFDKKWNSIYKRIGIIKENDNFYWGGFMNKLSKVLLLIIILIISILSVTVYLNINKKNEAKTNLEQFSSKATEVYSIKDKDFYLYKDADGRYEDFRGIKLLEFDNSAKNYIEIYYVSYDYTTDPSFYYSLEITDESNNSLLLEGEKEQQVIGGVVSTVKIKKLSLDRKINFSIFEKNTETNDIINSSQIQIDLEKDLEEKVKINQSSNLKNGKLGDVNFKYIDSKTVYFGTTSHAYSKKLVGENASLPIKIQYGNRLIQEEHIEVSYNKNVNNLNLEEAFENLVLINYNFGQYGLSDVYGMDITNKQGEVIDTVIINFEEMIKLCKGLAIQKDGKEYTKSSFDGFADMSMIKDENVVIGNGINAIKYHFESDEDYEHYMFIYKDNIYEIKIPINQRINYEIQQFLNSLELIA